jgi:hypothetical protein
MGSNVGCGLFAFGVWRSGHSGVWVSCRCLGQASRGGQIRIRCRSSKIQCLNVCGGICWGLGLVEFLGFVMVIEKVVLYLIDGLQSCVEGIVSGDGWLRSMGILKE